MTIETFLLITTVIGTFIGSIVGGIVASTRKNASIEKRVTDIKTDTDAVDKRVKELEADKAMLEEARAARDRRIDALETELEHVRAQVQTLTDEKAEVVRERNDLQNKLVNAENEIQKLHIRIIKLESQSEAEKNANERIVKPIVEALAKLAVQTRTGDTDKLNPAALDHASDANEKPAA